PGGGMAGMEADKAMLRVEERTSTTAGATAAKPVRVRQFFPETLLVEPSLITDASGKATLSVPMADSITSWRMTALANSMLGGLGSTTGNLRCFQDFFIDLDLPVALTQGDRVSIPVAVYNYLPEPQKVRLELTKADWFELTGPDQYELNIGPNQVDVRYFTVTAKKLGSGKLLVHGYGSQMSDAIERVADVEPNGKLFETSAGGRLSGEKTETVSLPEDAIADASNILVKIYPGIFSQAVEGLDSILRMPSGCFEQTSSSTYPNVLVLDYMKTTGRISSEIQMKAEGYINNGYQRLVTFEVKGGGFSWFGDAPANKILTAFGCMEFSDMARVHEVDPNLLSRTQEWLLSEQGPDGAWEADKAYLHQESWGRIQNSKLPPTSYVTWGLTYSGCKDERVSKAVAYLRDHAAEAKDPYVLSMLCNALVNADLQLAKGDFSKSTNDALDRLLSIAKREKGQMWWETEMTGITHSSGQSSDLEATGMAALALIAGGRNGEAAEVLNYLIAKKDPSGTWYSTQATVLALRALMASQKSSTSQVNGECTVLINGQKADAFGLTPDNADVMRQVDGRKFVKPGRNEVTVKFEGKGSTLYQVVGRYYLPWEKLAPEGKDLLQIGLTYDRTTLNKDDLVTADVSVKNNAPGTTSMIIVDLGIPPGFEVQAGDFDNLVERGTLQKYSLTGRQVICYIEKLDPQQTLKFSYRLRAKFPIHAQTPKSRVCEYYNPANDADAKPVEMEVK
ncbi:MAG: alpha-2-macroglobulin family protein, partial [Armatimonadota bacterium]